MRWAEQVARIAKRGEVYTPTGFWWGNLRERENLGDPGTVGRIILK
jgi:hypothetical protein